MDQAVAIIAVALITGVISGVVGPTLLNRQLRANKQLDWEREDKVALRAAKVAADLEARDEKRAAAAAKAAGVVLEKIGEVHTLVNSDMTASRTNELNATILLAAALRRIADPTVADEEAIEGAEAQIITLRQILADRLVAQQKVEAQQTAAKLADAKPAGGA